MASGNANYGAVVAPLILFGVGCLCIGYDLAKIANDLDGAGPLAGVGSMCAGLAAVLFGRAAAANKE